MEISLRRAKLEDSENILSWRNEPSTIPWMANTRKLSLEEHNTWYIGSLNKESILMLIIEVENEAVGQIRYTLNSEIKIPTARVSLNVTEKMHGKGVGSRAFNNGNLFVEKENFASVIYANVRSDNIGSIKALARANYRQTDEIKLHNVDHVVMTYYCENKL